MLPIEQMKIKQELNSLIKINNVQPDFLLKGINAPYYFILIVEGSASFTVDFTDYECKGKNLIFLSPYQLFQWHGSSAASIQMIQFHGDFYCIEYHKKEVACNGILFNNIYQQPYVSVDGPMYREITGIVERMQELGGSNLSYDTSVIKSYLQLILALSSKEKQQQTKPIVKDPDLEQNIHSFQSLLEDHFLESKDVAFYASKFGLSVNTFSKKVKKHFGKTSSKLIQERIVLEAKKLLHLTYKSIKEVAAELNFEDEFYFSRYFKKEVGLSPKKFREEVGISIVAK